MLTQVLGETWTLAIDYLLEPGHELTIWTSLWNAKGYAVNTLETTITCRHLVYDRSIVPTATLFD